MNKKLLSLYGLKWNPFSPELPSEALRLTPAVESFCWRVEQSLVREGGFALITGEPGTGKSVGLRLLAERLAALRDVAVGALAHPQSQVADFYRELGDLFGVPLKPHNRWGGFKALRERWQAHIETTLVRPVLLVDEAQEMNPSVLTELRLLTSMRFDSRVILSVVLAGDARLQDKLREEELLSLGSRLRVRIALEPWEQQGLQALLEHRLEAAGGGTLLTPGLKTTLVERAAGNPRTLLNMGQDLLVVGVHRELKRLDEKLFLEVFGGGDDRPSKRGRRSA